MEAIRSIQIVTNGAVYLQLPKQFWGQEVEIIVLPSVKQTVSKANKILLTQCCQEWRVKLSQPINHDPSKE